MNIIFLDYDGVVNTPMWGLINDIWRVSYNFPEHGKVNDLQAVQWISEFCEKYDYSIVVTSSWRHSKNYKECLYNAGLRDGIKILGKTPSILNGDRGDEIIAWLVNHNEVEKYIIIDDEDDMGDLTDHLVLCETSHGFKELEYQKAVSLHNKLKNK